MHQLIRRTALAVLGTGLGVAAAVTMAAGPGFAQNPTPNTAAYWLTFQDLDVPSAPESGDKIDGQGTLWDSADQSQSVGSFSLTCHYLDGNSAQCSMEHFFGSDYLHFAFEAEVDATGILTMPDRESAILTDGTGQYLGAVGNGWLTNQTGQSIYYWQHSAFLAPNA